MKENSTVAPAIFEGEKNEINILNHKEYNIKYENENYCLRIEIDNKYITFILSKLNEPVNFNYKNKYDLLSIVNTLTLNPSKHSNLNEILDILDKVYLKNKLSILKVDDNTINLIIKFNIIFDEVTHELKLYKIYMSSNDKFNFLYNEIKLIQQKLENVNTNKNNEIEQIQKKIKEMDLSLIKKNEEINKINLAIKERENIINEQKEMLIKLNNTIVELNNSLIEKENRIKIVEDKLEEKEIIINNLDIIIKNKEINDNEISYQLKNTMNEINNDLNVKYNELLNMISNLEHNEFIKKINYKFEKDPQGLKFRQNIINSNASYGWNDIFEVYISRKDNKEYLVSPNNNNYKLDVISLLENKVTVSLKGHNNHIRTIRYFINNINSEEYLISADNDIIVIIWEITYDFNMKFKINTNYSDNIYSCLLLFDLINENNYIVTSSYAQLEDNEKSATKLYSLENGQLIKYISYSNKSAVYYLLSWYNKNNNKYYIVQFTFKAILINSVIDDELYCELIQEPEDNHLSGFIYNSDNKDYLCSSSYNGYIHLWDLFNKSIYKIISTNDCVLCNIIQWNNKYSIVADYDNKSFKIIDFEKGQVVKDIKGEHTDKVPCVKKLYHPLYGESLLSAGQDNTIKLWSL
jgi:WD40 repeat protein